MDTFLAVYGKPQSSIVFEFPDILLTSWYNTFCSYCCELLSRLEIVVVMTLTIVQDCRPINAAASCSLQMCNGFTPIYTTQMHRVIYIWDLHRGG